MPNQELTKKIAKLAKLALDESELDYYTEELTKILCMLEKIQAVSAPINEVTQEPYLPILAEKLNPLRSDEIISHLSPEMSQELEQLAPQFKDGYYIVPKIRGQYEE